MCHTQKQKHPKEDENFEDIVPKINMMNRGEIIPQKESPGDFI